MEENKNMLLKSAMTYGFALGIFWVVKFLFYIFSAAMPILNFVYMGLTFCVPFIAYYLTKRYKQDIGGNISFFHAWRFGTMLYFFAALIVSIEHFIFFQFIASPDFIPNTIQSMTEILKNNQADTEIINSIKQLHLSPIRIVIQLIFNNVFYGIILSIPVAAIVCQTSTASYNQSENNK